MTGAEGADLRGRVKRHLELIYSAEPAEPLVDAVLEAVGLSGMEAGGTELARPTGPRWDQNDVAVITYADSITESGKVPLQTLAELLDDLTGDVATVVHVLPFYPSSSDGGFAITDHQAVDPRLGTWADITRLSEDYTVMADLVVNHVSADHAWMEQFCNGTDPGRRYLLTAQPEDDLSAVTRPRTTPLLREVETPAGPELLWCTFSHDQIDLDFAEPDVLVEMLGTVACLVDAGVRWFRLDAVAFVWKELGTTCLNLPQTHEIVKLLRTLLDARCTDAVIITETNVPHEQNIAYWGEGDEAHLVYNFSLPPLVAHTLLSGSADAMQRWLARLEPPPAGTSYFNFLASHDGIGLRPVEGLLSTAEIRRLVMAAALAGGTHSEFDSPKGPRAYELNVSLWDLFATEGPEVGAALFLAAHTIMLSLEGIPALYVHALLGTPSYWAPISEPPRIVTEHGLPPVEQNKRTINRRKLTLDEAVGLLASQDGIRRKVLVELVRRLLVRRGQPAFHPNSAQASLELGAEAFGVMRGGPGTDQTIVSITNVTADAWSMPLEHLWERCAGAGAVGHAQLFSDGWVNLLGEPTVRLEGELALSAGESAWLCRESEHRPAALGRSLGRLAN